MRLLDAGRSVVAATDVLRGAGSAADEVVGGGLRAALGELGADVVSPERLRAARAGDVLPGWGIHPTDIEALQEAEARGVRFLNSSDAVLHSHRKGNLAGVLEAAGVPHAANGVLVRTKPELERAVAQFGGEARVAGGFSHSRLSTSVATGVGGDPNPTLVSEATLGAFADDFLDHTRTYFVQAAPNGARMHVATAGASVVHETGTGPGLAPAEQQVAVRAARAFGLDAAGVDLVRGEDGVLRVLDVHATPRGMSPSELGELAGSRAFADAIEAMEPAATGLADRVEAARPQVGVLNMGRIPGKNISRTFAEIERQGAHPTFLPAHETSVSESGVVRVRSSRTPLDAVLTRTGSVISDDAVRLLKRLDESGIPVMNGWKPMSLVRDKNTQARRLVESGVAHLNSTTVRGVDDVDHAIEALGLEMVVKNGASSEGRGVMFLEGEDVIRGVVNLFEKRTEQSRLFARSTVDPSQLIELTDRASAERAIRELGRATSVTDATTGHRLLKINAPIELFDDATGAGVHVDQPLAVLTIGDAFRDAKPGAVLKAETWVREAAGVDTRVHVGRIDGEHQVLAAMERRAAPNEFGEARSNLSLIGEGTAVTPDALQQETAIAAANAFDLDIAGVDLIQTKDGPVVLEVNASPGLDVEKATGPVADRWITETLRRAEAQS